MTDELRQRRGKKSNDNARTTKEDSPASSPGATSGSQVTPIEQLRHAQAKLMVSRDRTADLHTAWRNQLFRLNLIIAIVSLHQFHAPISSCIREIKDFNEATSSAEEGATDKLISGLQAIRILFGESFVEILGVVISFLLAYFLALGTVNPVELDSWPYVVSSALIPMQLGFYFHSNQLGCLGGNERINSDDPPVTHDRQFPVVVIFHTIVTVAFWFMKSGMERCEEHVKMVNDSIVDFERMDKKLELKKKLKGSKKK